MRTRRDRVRRVQEHGMAWAEWLSGGSRAPVRLSSGTFEIFRRVQGEGPWLTFLHGFPSSSYDYAGLAEALAPRQRLLLFDFLGFGDSDKPKDHSYSLFEQADLVEALWREQGVTETGLVAHDYGATVAVELLARQEEGRLAVGISRALLMNAGLYLDAYRPRPIQRLLQWPLVGPLLAACLNEAAFKRAFGGVFAPATRPSDAELHEHWLAVSRRDGHRRAAAVIRYIGERRRHVSRFEGTLRRTAVPLRFVWGQLDPVSGAAVARRIREERTGADMVALGEVGHYPQLEAPERVARELLDFFGSNPQRRNLV